MFVDHIDEEPVLSMLDRALGDGEHVAVDAKREIRGHRQPRPQRVVLIGELRLQSNCAGRNVHQIVADGELAGGKPFALGVLHGRFQGAPSQLPVDAVDIFLGLGEDDGNRLQLCNRHNAGLLAGVDEIALIDQPEPDPTGYGRANGRVIELDPRRVDRRRVRRDGCRQLIDERVLSVELLLRGEVLLGERRVT